MVEVWGSGTLSWATFSERSSTASLRLVRSPAVGTWPVADAEPEPGLDLSRAAGKAATILLGLSATARALACRAGAMEAATNAAPKNTMAFVTHASAVTIASNLSRSIARYLSGDRLKTTRDFG